MSEQEITTADAQSPKPAKNKRAKRATKKATLAPKDAPFVSSVRKDSSLEDIEREIAELELETKRVLLMKARQEVETFHHDRRTKEEKAARAQDILQAAKREQDTIKSGCTHRLGGIGLEDTYNGDRESSLAVMDLPVANAKYVICVRCLGEWRTPNPALKHSDPDRYSDQVQEWKEALLLLRNAKIKPMAGPTFMFTDSEGRPVHPPTV